MTLQNCILLSFILFAIGVYGVLTRRNLIGILLSVEIRSSRTSYESTS